MSPGSVEAELVDLTFRRYEQYLNPSMAALVKFMGFESVEVEAEGCYVRDADGNEYLDCWSGPAVCNMGHRPARVVGRVAEQLDRMPISSHIMLNPVTAELAERLAEVTPGALQYSFLCNSGAEAVEGALKAARAHTKRTEFVAAEGGFHGKTFGALSASGRDVYRDPFKPLLPGFTHVPFGDAHALAEAVGERTAAVILEPIQGEGGIIVPPDDYLPRAREICDEAGALLILDEIQTGMARTGKWWACEWPGVEPDIMTLGKALGGGVMPIGAFVARPEIWDIFEENPYVHTSTFGGNPLACAAALGAMEAVEEEGLCAKAAERGEQLMTGLRGLTGACEGMIEEVRGRGLLIGVQFADPDVAGLIIASLAGEGVLAAYTLNNPSVIRFEPPLVITAEQVEEVLAAFSRALETTAALLQ